jgi:UDPglucose 6-dehydrogenase
LLAYTARRAGVEAPLAEASDRVNKETNASLFKMVKHMVTKNDVVAVLGLSYKPDTYITEESAGLYLAQQLKQDGYKVVVHDYGARPDIAPSVHEFEHLDDPNVLQKREDVKLAVICCPWPQYRSVKFAPGTKVLTPWKL